MFLKACLSSSYINILCHALKPRESKRLQAVGQWSIGALGGVPSVFCLRPQLLDIRSTGRTLFFPETLSSAARKPASFYVRTPGVAVPGSHGRRPAPQSPSLQFSVALRKTVLPRTSTRQYQ